MTDQPNQLQRIEPKVHSQYERIERFQALAPGKYWRTVAAIPSKAIAKGDVLLLKSIRWVDNQAHTLIIEPHPLKLGRSETVKYVDEAGVEQSVWVKNDEHRFLLREFLDLFEFEPDAAAIRERELGQLQARISDLQQSLVEAQSNPSVLDEVVRLHFEAEAANRIGEDGQSPAVAEEAAGAMPQMALTVADAVATGISAESIASMTQSIDREKQVATIKSNWMLARTKEISATIQQMVPFYSEQASAALAATEEVVGKANALMDGVQSLNLYVGTDVEVEEIAKGVSAPKSEKLTLMQRKLVADEELCMWCDVDENFDFTKDAVLLQALRDHQGFVDQIFPTQRCIVVMATTRRFIDYGDSYSNMVLNARNKEVFMLVRDGQNIYRIYSPVESHLKTGRLFPSKDEQGACFAGVDGTTITFEDVAYTDGVKKHEIFALHYKRFLLLIAGLDFRLKLFGEFYDGEASLAFMTLAFQEENLRFIHDEDGTGLLPGEKRPSLAEWLEEKNSFMRSGSRVLCNLYTVMNPDTAPGACKPDRFRDSFEFRSVPATDIYMGIAYKDGDSLNVKVPVEHRYTDRQFSCRVELTAHRSGSWNRSEIPYLCLDTVSPEEVLWYMNKRDVRVGSHLKYIRFFKRALRHIETERAQELGARQYLKESLEAGKIASGRAADELVNQAVLAWRAKNRGEPLPDGASDKSSKDWKTLLDQLFMLAGAGQARIAQVEAFAQAQGIVPLRLVLSGSAKLVLYAEPSQAERDDRLVSHAWVHRITFKTIKSGLSEVSRSWSLMPLNVAAETLLMEWKDPGHWANADVRLFASMAEKKAVFAMVDQFKARFANLVRAADEDRFNDLLNDWRTAREIANARSGYVREPEIVVPFGVVGYPKSGAVSFIALNCGKPHALLRDLAPNADALAKLSALFARKYHSQKAARDFFNEDFEWSLCTVNAAGVIDSFEGFIPGVENGVCDLRYKSDEDYLLSSKLKLWYKEQCSKDGKGNPCVFFGGLDVDSIGLLLDSMTGHNTSGSQLVNVHQVIGKSVSMTPDCEGRSFVIFDLIPVEVDVFERKNFFSAEERGLAHFGFHSGSYSISSRTFYSMEDAVEFAQKKARQTGKVLLELPADGVEFPPSVHAGAKRFLLVDS